LKEKIDFGMNELGIPQFGFYRKIWRVLRVGWEALAV